MLQQNTSEYKSPVRARYYGTENSEAATGFKYRFLRDQARALGVKIYKLSGGRRLAIDADDFDRKLQALTEQQAAATQSDPTRDVLATLGLEVRQ